MLTITRERIAILAVTGLVLWSRGPTPPHIAAAVAAVCVFWWLAGPREIRDVAPAPERHGSSIPQ